MASISTIALKGTSFRWLDLDLLAKRLVRPGDTIDMVRYFTARVKARAGDPDAPRRQQLYLGALGTLPNVEFHFGSFLMWRWSSRRTPISSSR
jgi:hypothetical protein